MLLLKKITFILIEKGDFYITLIHLSVIGYGSTPAVENPDNISAFCGTLHCRQQYQLFTISGDALF